MFFSQEHVIFYEYVTGKKETLENLRANSALWYNMAQSQNTSSTPSPYHSSSGTSPRPRPRPRPRRPERWPTRHHFIAPIEKFMNKHSDVIEKLKAIKKKTRIRFVELPHVYPETPRRCRSVERGTQTPESRSPERSRSRSRSRERVSIPRYRDSSRRYSPNRAYSPQPSTSMVDLSPPSPRKPRSLRRTSPPRERSTSEVLKFGGAKLRKLLQSNPDNYLLVHGVPVSSKADYAYNGRPRSRSLDSHLLYPNFPSPPSPAPYDPDEEYRRQLRRSLRTRPTYDLEDISSESDEEFEVYLSRHNISKVDPEPYRHPEESYKSEPRNINSKHNYPKPAPPEQKPAAGKTKMNSMDEHDRKIIIEFCHLLEKSKQLFNGLRELPQYGHKQWHSYFGRTFDVYTKLWKFQQKHRGVLDSKYGLKRWQIGEIASKIGQLYYHFYLRTSETGYLTEAYSFYSAIRGRSYYTQACKEDKCELMVKKLRYYARFIVVGLLLKKLSVVRELIKELDKQIIEYGNTYDPEDQIEWTVVMDEVKAFIIAEAVVSVIHPDNYAIVLSYRLNSLTVPPPERPTPNSITLQEAIIVGSVSQQVKFSELTMDMYRILQTLEWEPTGEIPHAYNESPDRFPSTPQMSKGHSSERHENPHKYLLFKPSAAQVLVYLASGCFDLPPNGALLLYISADAYIPPPSKHSEDGGYGAGGLITSLKSDLYRERDRERERERERDRDRERDKDRDHSRESKSMHKYKEPQCIYPGDLYPFTRSPMFIIIDSDNSYVFGNIPRTFGQPLLVLMSPVDLPTSFPTEHRKEGSFFTLFLHSPLTAFCYCCDIKTTALITWERAQSYVEAFLIEACQLMTRYRIDPLVFSFMADDFLRLLVLRYLFCEVTLRRHRAFRSRSQLPRAWPPFPEDLLENPTLVHIIMDLAAHLQVRSHFHEPAGPAPRD